MGLTERQKYIFRLVVEGHIASGEPVGSEWVVERLPQKCSSATVRSELLELERNGFLRQPHTSAGRVPTEDGYRAYIELFVRPSQEARDVEVIENKPQYLETSEEKVRRIARELSQLAGNVVMVGIDPRSLYSVGMGRMYESPEAHNIEIMQNISLALDRADDLMEDLFDVAATTDVKILIGKQNPIDENLSLIVTKYATSDGERIMALLGFMRMRYDRNIALMQAMKRLLESEM